MKVSKRSWHYRLYRFYVRFVIIGINATLPKRFRDDVNEDPADPNPKSLCTYFWSVLLLTLSLIPIALAIPIIAVIAWTVLFFTKIKEWRKRRRKDRPVEQKPDKGAGFWKMTAAFVVAKKRRICPRIQLID